MKDTLDWAYEFRDAPDLQTAGGTLTRKLEAFVEAGPPTNARDLADRKNFQAVVAAFIGQSRERDFEYVKIPDFALLFKTSSLRTLRPKIGPRCRSTGRKAAPPPPRSPLPPRRNGRCLRADGIGSQFHPRLDEMGPQRALRDL